MPASFRSDTLGFDKLFAGPTSHIHSRAITLLSGENRTRGAVLGKTATAGTVVGAAGAGNTGNGTIGTLSAGGAAKEGVYKVVFVEPATNLGTFVVEDPDGLIVGRGVVGTAFSGPVVFTITDGSTDMVSGDYFDVTVTAVTYKYKLSALAATDGSQFVDVVLAEDTDASAGDVATVAYDRGDFAESALTLGTGHTADTIRDRFRRRGITLVKTVA